MNAGRTEWQVIFMIPCDGWPGARTRIRVTV